MTSKELKEWRQRTGYTQAQLAQALGVTNVCISRWEREEEGEGKRQIPSFLHLALRCLELEGGEQKKGTKRKGGKHHG